MREDKLNSLPLIREWLAEQSNPGIEDKDRLEIMYCAKYWVIRARKPPVLTEAIFHAKDDGDARLKFYRSETSRKMRKVQLVGIAPVIGYLVDDNHGDKLTV